MLCFLHWRQKKSFKETPNESIRKHGIILDSWENSYSIEAEQTKSKEWDGFFQIKTLEQQQMKVGK